VNALAIPTALAGAITLLLIVVLGIFVYPWLLQKRRFVVVAIATVLLALLFAAFQAGSGETGLLQIVIAAALAAVPLIAGLIVARLQSGASK
jgi:glucan phosphoethanolaminetransferase (alkaline phosphatase superfamily)